MPHPFLVWEHHPASGWRPAMDYQSLGQAQDALRDWIREFTLGQGQPPEAGRDFLLTEVLAFPVGPDAALDAAARATASWPENRHPGPRRPRAGLNPLRPA